MSQELTAALAAFALCLANATALIIIIRLNINKNWKKFTNIVFGSMAVRYFVVAAMVWFCLKILELHPAAFSFTFLISCFVFIFLEILYINNRSKFVNLQNRLSK